MIGIDSNILIYAHNRASPYYGEAKQLIHTSIEENTLGVSELSLREFYAVITDGWKVEKPVQPTTASVLLQNYFESEKVTVCKLTREVWRRAFEYTARYHVARYDLDDLLIALTLSLNGLESFYTRNTKDFKKFDFIEAINPFESPAPRSPLPALRFIPYARQSIDEKDVASVCSVLRSDWLTTGPNVEEFEQAVADYVGAKHAVVASSGTAALHLACLADGMAPGNEGVTSPITFLASANAMVYCGAAPRFTDIDLNTYNMSAAELEKCITKRTRVIIPVHFAGQSCDMKRIRDVVSKKERLYGQKIYIIEDASHALGSSYKESRVGCCEYSDMTIFSFHPVKHVTTGEGGMVVTNDKKLASRIRKLRSHGIIKNSALMSQNPGPWYYEQDELGFNYRLTDIQCALGRSQLKKLSLFKKRRSNIVNEYNSSFRELDHVVTPFESPECQSNFHLYVVQIEFDSLGISRQIFMESLKDAGIQTQVHYIPVHLQPFYRSNFGTKIGDCPVAERYYEKCLSLPLYPGMSAYDVRYVISHVTQELTWVNRKSA